MELNLQKNPVFINEAILNVTVEQPIECDALLPDYCPEIGRILRCSMVPSLMGRSVSSGRLTVEGMALLNILYLSPSGEPARGEYKVPFSRTLELPAEARDPILTVTLRTGRVTCRAVSPRRLDLRGSVIVQASAITCREEEFLCGSAEPTLQLRRHGLSGVQPAALSQREQRLQQTVVLPGSGVPLARVLRCSAAVASRGERRSDMGLTLHGEVAATALAACEDGTCRWAETTLPYEVTLELPGLSEETPCDVWQEVLSAAAEPAADEDGECRALAWDITLVTHALLYRLYSCTVCTDSYSTRYASAARTGEVNTIRLLSLCGEGETLRQSLPLPEQLQEVTALWVTPEGCAVHPEEESLLAEGRLTVTLLGRMADGTLSCFDRTLEPTHSVPGAAGAHWEARLECRACRWELHGGELQLELSLWWSGAVTQQVREAALTAVTVDERSPRSDTPPRGLYIYMAQEGESLWEVARRYNTSEERIRADNGVPGESCPAGALLIPV